jgi:hypothetical protein
MRKPPRATKTAGALALAAITALVCAMPQFLRAGDDWQPIDPADLAMKDNAKSPGADAMILYRESFIDEDASSITEYRRIKIFTQAGAKYGDIEIPYAKGVTSIGNLKARTIRADGSVVEFQGKPFDKTIVKASGVKVLAKTFSLPDIAPGCIIEYRYREQRDSNYYINQRWLVQGDLYLRYGRFSIRPYSGAGAQQLAMRRYDIPAGIDIAKQPNGTYALDVHDVPGLEEEDYMPPADSLRARVEFFYRGGGAPSNETEDQYWKRIDKILDENLEKYVSKKGALERDVAATVSPADTPDVKLRKIYDRVQKLRNLNMEDEKTAKEEKQEKLKENTNVEDVLKHGYGYDTEINFTFVGLCRAAGFQANVLYVAPRSEGLFYPKMQDASQLNDDMVWVNAGGKDYYLDPAAHYYPFGLLPWSESEAGGLRVKKDVGDFIQTPALPSTDAQLIRHVEIDVNDEGEAAGKITVDFAGRFGAMRRLNEHDKDEAGRRKAYENEIKDWLPPGSTFSATSLSNWDDTTKPLRVEGTVKIPSFGTTAGKRMLAPMEIFQARQTRSFTAERRKNDLDFYYPYEEIDDVQIHLPKTYKIETVPKAQTVSLGPVSYEISANGVGTTIAVKRHLKIDKVIFPRANYPVFRDFFSKVKSNDDADVVLENVESAKN